jgi:GNAT superfamily N-acetyltransferase
MINKLKRQLQERGLRGTAAKFAERLRNGYVSEELVVLVKDLGEIVEPRGDGDLQVEGLERRHLPGLAELNRERQAPGADRYFENALEEGIQGFVALRDGRTIGYYHWVDGRGGAWHPDMWNLGADFALAPDDVYGAGLFLLEDERGAGAAADFLFQIETNLRDRGYRRLWGYVVSTNRPARWTYMTRGYEIAWRVKLERLVFYRRRTRLAPETG